MNVIFRCLPLIWFAALLCQCGVPRPPQCHTVPLASRAPAPSLVSEARRNWSILGDPDRQTEWSTARARYNTAVAKLFDQLRCGPGGWENSAAAIGTRIAPPDRREVELAELDALFPASSVSTRVVRTRRTTEGVGVPLVGWKKTSPVGQKRERFLLPNGLPYLVTATLDFDTETPTWRFSKRWRYDETGVGSATHTLAADWTAPNAFYWHMCDLDDLKIQNVILPDRYMEESGVYFVEPYDPRKIPVVFVHGLVSSPDAFKNMINELAPEPWFRERYQIWLYNYPTGTPWIYNSMKFRALMREACDYARSNGGGETLDDMVIVGHSMGGLIARSSVTDPPGKLQVSASARTLIHDTTLYQPLKEPSCVVFLAVPHRGSPMATLRISSWISRLIRLPKTLTVELLDNTLLAVGDVVQGDDPAQRFPTSINSLSPNAKATIALNRLPLPKGIEFHSIIGDRGKGDTPNSSDGIVPYWSSHIAPVASECIVPCHHGVPDNPEAAEELKRILKHHLKDH